MPSSSLEWSTDPVAFYRLLHPSPVLVTVGGRRVVGNRFHDIGSLDDPAAVGQSGLLDDPHYHALWWSVLGRRPLQRLRPHADLPGFYSLGRLSRHTAPSTITACWLDLDIEPGSPYAPTGQTNYARLVTDALACGKAAGWPAPTILVQSGAGLWLLWCLRTATGQAVAFDHDTTWAAWQPIQHALIQTFAGLHADPACKDHARLMRIPGSTHANGHQVAWCRGGGDVYTLDALAAVVPTIGAFPAAVPRTRALVSPARTRGIASSVVPPLPALPDLPALSATATRGMKGARAVRLRRVESLYRLAFARGGFYEGQRHHALLVALDALRDLYLQEWDAIARALSRINDDLCRPPQRQSDLDHMVASARRTRGQYTTRVDKDRSRVGFTIAEPTRQAMPYAWIRSTLGVSDDEAVRLGVFVARRRAALPERKGVYTRRDAVLWTALERLLRDRHGEDVNDSEAARLLAQRGVLNPSTNAPFNRRQVKRIRAEMARFA